MLIYGGELHGVRVYLTQDAYVAQGRLHANKAVHGEECSCRGLIDRLTNQLIAGTLTFVSAQSMATQPELSRYHSGTFEFGEALARLCGVKHTELSVSIPFTSGNREDNEAFLRRGYRPRLALMQSLLQDSLREEAPNNFVAAGSMESSA